MKEIYSLYADKIKKQEKKESLTGVLLTTILIGGLAVATYLELKQKPIEYEGLKKYTFEVGQGLSDATMTVDRDPNSVPYQEVNQHIAEMPENTQSLSDGIQAGETITVPESAERR
jgi:hypothetical protein